MGPPSIGGFNENLTPIDCDKPYPVRFGHASNLGRDPCRLPKWSKVIRDAHSGQGLASVGPLTLKTNTLLPVTITPLLLPELAPTGHLRASLNIANTILAHSNTEAAKPAGVTIDLSRELARRLGVAVEFLEWDAPGESLRALADGAGDVGYLAVDPKRAQEVYFTFPYVQIEACYLAKQESALTHQSQVDQPGTEVLVMDTSAYDLFLTRHLQHATLVRLPAEEVFPALREDRTGRRVAAGIKQALLAEIQGASGFRLLDGCFLAIQQAMVLPSKSSAAARSAIRAFLAEMISTGFIAESLERHQISGATVLSAP